MQDINTLLTEIAWPLTVLLAWIAGEFVHQRLKLPKISVYALIGFGLSGHSLGWLSTEQSPNMLLLANIAFGLILFECGYRFNIFWIRKNLWLTTASVVESTATFGAVYLLFSWIGQPAVPSLMIASLAMATSPATVLRVINEQKSSGQVTERILHLSVLNCLLAVFSFKVIVGWLVFQTSGNLLSATYSSVLVLCASLLLGSVAGALVSTLLRALHRVTQDSTLVFTIAVVLVVSIAHSLKLSPVLAALTFGVMARHQRIALSASQRGFGALGDLMSILLFVYVAATVSWHSVVVGFSLGATIILVRQVVKIATLGAFARVSGISWRKGFLVGVATAPMSAFVILMLEQTRHLGIQLLDQLPALVTGALLMEILGPLLVQYALMLAKESHSSKE